ncbi:MAG TPA: glycosyltransferase [Bryobacteraceae bacterium]|nr:glycosyltransferase [Bryobacteraceae bacterium]
MEPPATEPYAGRQPAVTAVVPSFRGAPRIEALCARLLPVLQALDGELVLVDDFSDDGTWKIMIGISAVHPRICCLRLRRRGGQQAATLAGCAAARGRWIVTLDDDLEHRPEDLPRLLDRGRQGFDLVYAVPRSRPTRPLRLAGSRIFDFFFSILIGKPDGLRLTSFRALRGSLVRRMLADRTPALYVSALALRQRPRVGSIFVDPGPRASSRTTLPSLALTFCRTLLAYGPLSTLSRAKPVRDLLPEAEVVRSPR